MALVGPILDTARTHLNDDGGAMWPDTNIMPKFQEAFREMLLELENNGLSVIREISTVMTVAAGDTDLSLNVGYPTDLIVPMEMKERQVGQLNNQFVPMTKIDYVPNIERDVRLIWWSWRTDRIILLGATVANQVELRYQGSLAVPTKNSDSIPFIFAEMFLSRRTASLCYASVGNFDRADYYDKMAYTMIAKIVQMNVNRDLQTLPAKRQGYHRRFRTSSVIRGI